MSRLPLLCPDTACEQGAPTLEAIHKQLGMLPNFFAGLDDTTLVEITSWVGLNSYSNWVNNLIKPKIDFPEVPLVE